MASLSGPNSRRRLGTQSGAMRREARTLARNGNRGAAGALQVAAAERKLAEGSAITSSEATINERSLLQARDRALMRQQRDSVLKPEAGAVDPSGGTQYKKAIDLPGGRTAPSNASYDSDNNGNGNGNGNANAPTVSVDSYGNTTAPANASPVRSPAAPPREGKIDGKPASQSLRRPTDSEPGNLRGLQDKDANERRSVISAAMAASADGATSPRTRQDVVDEANTARVAAGKDPFDDSIYTEMSGMDVSKTSFGRTGFGKAYNSISRPAASPSRDGPLLTFGSKTARKEAAAEKGYAAYREFDKLAGTGIPSLGAMSPVPKFKLRRPSSL